MPLEFSQQREREREEGREGKRKEQEGKKENERKRKRKKEDEYEKHNSILSNILFFKKNLKRKDSGVHAHEMA